MSAQDNVELVKKAYTAFNSGDIELLLDMYAEDADWVLPSIEDAPEGVPYTGSRKGRAQMGEFLVALANAEEVLDFTQQDFIAQGNKVAVRGRYKARIVGADGLIRLGVPAKSVNTFPTTFISSAITKSILFVPGAEKAAHDITLITKSNKARASSPKAITAKSFFRPSWLRPQNPRTATTRIRRIHGPRRRSRIIGRRTASVMIQSLSTPDTAKATIEVTKAAAPQPERLSATSCVSGSGGRVIGL